ncbi:hypothetical protein BP00DRAFT_452695, partial [Aspergillus indologenus CBS 114.80]
GVSPVSESGDQTGSASEQDGATSKAPSATETQTIGAAWGKNISAPASSSTGFQRIHSSTPTAASSTAAVTAVSTASSAAGALFTGAASAMHITNGQMMGSLAGGLVSMLLMFV